MSNIIVNAPTLVIHLSVVRSAVQTFTIGLVQGVNLGFYGGYTFFEVNSPSQPFIVGELVTFASVGAPFSALNTGSWAVNTISQALPGLWACYILYVPTVNAQLFNSGTVSSPFGQVPGILNVVHTNPEGSVNGVKLRCGTVKVFCGNTVEGGNNELRLTLGNVFVRTQATFTADAAYRRWASVVYNKQIFFTNELNPITFTDGSSCFRYSNRQPSARYIDVFFDHLILGWPTNNGSPSPTRVQWSDLYRLNQWTPSPKNEADSYDIEEWCSQTFPLTGCTGLGRIGNTMWVYTPTAIVSMRYQGRMKSPVFNQSLTGAVGGAGGPIFVMGDRVMKDIGNSMMWSLVVYKDAHYFWDGVEQDFYRFDGEKVESIGIKIKGYFLSNVNMTWSLFQSTWGYARPGRQEIVWIFVSNKQTSLVFDQAIVFNWKTGRWYTQSVENVHSFAGPALSGGRADDLTGNANTLTGSADALLVSTSVNPPLWGGSAGAVLRESTNADPDSSLLPQDTPTLVTKDYGYDDLEHIKEASSIVLHATDNRGDGVVVNLSTRDSLDDPVVYPNPVLYKYNPDEKRLGLPRSSGRLLRYKFQPSAKRGPTRGFVWGGFVDNVKRKVADA